MNYEEISDFKINKMVADALGIKTVRYPHAADKRSVGVKNSEVHFEWFDYCNNPSDAWPIILANRINVYASEGPDFMPWMAGCGSLMVSNKNPLRAAMVVFLMMHEQYK